MMTKNRILFLAAIALIAVVASNCKKTYTLEPPPSKIEGINGTWELYNVIQVDEVDLAKAERDISKFYVGDGTTEVMKITFNSEDYTYEITLGEMGKNYLPLSGTWSFDDNDYPEYIFLSDDGGNITVLKLQSPTRPQDQQLKFSFQRSCTINGEDTEYVGYRYEFNRK